MVSDEMLLEQMVVIKDKSLLVDLIIFDMPYFHMILGMDFMGSYGAKINYWDKKVWFSLKEGDEFKFNEGWIKSMMISVIQGKRDAY